MKIKDTGIFKDGYATKPVKRNPRQPKIKPHWVCGKVDHYQSKVVGEQPKKTLFRIYCPCGSELQCSDKGIAIETWNKTFGVDVIKHAKL